MKYINRFSTNADYQAFTEGGYVTPNICYIEETEGLVFKPEIIENNTLQFPIYLVDGENGQIGIDLYNWLVINFDNWNPDTQEIYVNNLIVTWIVKINELYSLHKDGHPGLLDETGRLLLQQGGDGSN